MRRENNTHCQLSKEFKEPKNSMNSMDPLRGSSEKGNRHEAEKIGFAAAAIAAAAERSSADQKERLKRQIISVCGRENPVAEWVAGVTANLVIYHDVDYGEIKRIFADIDALRSCGSLKHAGKFFHSKARKLADRLGKPWPRDRSRSTENVLH